jgi:hypothetical protein
VAHQESSDTPQSFQEVLIREERGYPVNGVSTPITAADCNPHRVFSEAERHAQSSIPAITAREWQQIVDITERALRASGFFTDRDPGDER